MSSFECQDNCAMNENDYAPDEMHPIPSVDACDIEAARTDGGADLVIVIAAPIANDQRSRLRLMKKVENYLGYINSQSFAQRYGPPSPDRTGIIVRYHPHCAMGLIRLIEECRGWIEDNGAVLSLQPIDQ